MWALGVWLKRHIGSLIEAARANLTTTINTRATPANVTAVQAALTATVTAAQTAINNHVTNHVNSRTVAGGQPQAVRSVQRGDLAFTNNRDPAVTIAAVNVGKSVLTINGGAADNNANSSLFPRGRISTSTSLAFNNQNWSGRLNWEVVEYF